jgi:peptidoglycan hydrolase CwlO-like protein
MQGLIIFLIVFFILLILYQIFLANFIIKEGLDTSSSYQSYNTGDPNNAMILAQQNAGNIQVLKQQMDNLTGLNQEVQDISANVVSLQSQVSAIGQAQQQYATQMTSQPTPQITGAIPNTASTSLSSSPTSISSPSSSTT